MEELEKRGKAIREVAQAEFMPEDIELFNKKQRAKIEDWCNQFPILGFNSGRYDLNPIKEYFVERIAGEEGTVRVAKNANKIMFMSSKDFRFLDVINYLGPGTSYDKWAKAYGCKLEKSWFPYEWFDTPNKLDFPGLPDYPARYSRLRETFTLTLADWMVCKRVFREKGMRTFADWLWYYNELDVAPGLEALQKMREFYIEKGIDILKDAVSIPGVSLQYLMRGSIERGAELWTPCQEEYNMLKSAVVGGPSLVFTRFHEAGVTRIRAHQVKNPKLCRKVLGFDANALYLSTMAKDMLCGKGVIEHFAAPAAAAPAAAAPAAAAPAFTKKVQDKQWFGYAEVDIEIPQSLWEKLEEMPPFFINQEVPVEAVPQHMADYLQKTGRTRTAKKKLLDTLSAKKMLIYEPLLQGR